MPEQQYQYHDELLDHRYRPAHLHGQVVEHAAENTARQPQGEQADVGKQVADQPRGRIVTRPKAGSHIHPNRLVRIIIEESTDNARADKSIAGIANESRQRERRHPFGHERYREQEDKPPAQRADGIFETPLPRYVEHVHEHAEQNLDRAQHKREHHQLVLIEDIGVETLQSRNIDERDAEERTGQHAEHDGRRP